MHVLTFPTEHGYYFSASKGSETMPMLVIIPDIKKKKKKYPNLKAQSTRLVRAPGEAVSRGASHSWFTQLESVHVGAGSAPETRAPGRHARTRGKGEGGRAPAWPYPVIHQKVTLDRKEALDSGQGF